MYVHALENPATLAARWFETVVEYINNVDMYWTKSGSNAAEIFFSKRVRTRRTTLSSLDPYLSIPFPSSFPQSVKSGPWGVK